MIVCGTRTIPATVYWLQPLSGIQIALETSDSLRGLLGSFNVDKMSNCDDE